MFTRRRRRSPLEGSTVAVALFIQGELPPHACQTQLTPRDLSRRLRRAIASRVVLDMAVSIQFPVLDAGLMAMMGVLLYSSFMHT